MVEFVARCDWLLHMYIRAEDCSPKDDSRVNPVPAAIHDGQGFNLLLTPNCLLLIRVASLIYIIRFRHDVAGS